MTSPPDSGYRTPELWEAAYLWAMGFPLIDTTHDSEGQITFHFPDGGERLEDALSQFQRGSALVNALQHKQGYFQMRDAMTRELRDASTR